MIKIFKCFFDVIWNLELFLEKKILPGINRYQAIFMLQLSIGIIIYYVIGFIPKIYLIAFLVSFIVIYSFRFLKYRFFNSSSLKSIFSDFSLKSYFLSLIFISMFLFFIFQFINFIIFIATGENIGPKTPQEFVNTFYIIVSLESVLWFAFHIISNRILLQEIKIKVALYTAIATTISIIAEMISGKDLLKLPISLIILSYLWITYLIELSTRENIE